MKIIFLETVQDYGGARISTVELAARLKQKHEVLILDTYGSCLPFVEAVKDKGVGLEIAMPRENAFIISASKSKLKNILNFIAFIPHWFRLRLKVLEVIKEFNADYVIVNNSKVLSLLLTLNKRKYKIGLFARGWFLPKQILPKDRFLYKLLVDKYICVAEATRQAIYASELASLENIFVVHNAINIDSLPTKIATLANSENVFKILHSGGFLQDKGIHVSIEIAKILKEKGFSFKLIITGLVYKGKVSQDYYNYILSLIERYSLEDCVVIIKDKSNVIDYFRLCDIVIHPSASEGLPRVIMEAMALKKPVIANAVGGVTDFILNNYTGFLTNFNNIDDYVRHIELLAKDKGIYKIISENAYELLIRSYDVDSQIESFIKVFNKKD
jgi:glycosyltransferase involved in cell wall biosynthesis